MASQGYRRRIILINKKFQFTFAFYVCSWIFVLSLSYPLIIYSQFDYFIRVLREFNVPIPIDRIMQVREQLLTLLVFFQVVFLGMTVFISVFLAHRIAGPLYKLSQFFQRSAEKGRLVHPVFFRKTDHFQDIALEFNRMAMTIETSQDQKLKILRDQLQKLDDAASQPTQVKAIVAEIRNSLG